MCHNHKLIPLAKIAPKGSDFVKILAIADKHRAVMARAVLTLFEAIRDSVPLASIEKWIRDGQINSILNAFGNRLSAQVLEIFRKIFVDAGVAGAEKLNSTRAVGKALAFVKLEMSIAFDVANPKTIDFINSYQLDLIRQIDDATREGIRGVVTRAVERGGSALSQAREIKTFVGLTAKQAKSLEKVYDNFLASGIPQATADKRLAKLVKKALKDRALTIARTETVRAANMGQQAIWQQAAEAGLLDGARRVWIVTPDDRLCPICAELDGAFAELNTNFNATVTAASGSSAQYTAFTPPLHPRCRCAMGLNFAETTYQVPAATQVAVPSVQSPPPTIQEVYREDIVGDAVATWSREQYPDNVVAGMPSADKKLLDDYQGALYGRLNSYLWQKKGTKFSPEMSKDLFEKAANLDRILQETAITDNVVTFRGIRKVKQLFGIDLSKKLVGTTFLAKGFLSSSFSGKQAGSFRFGSPESAVLKIRVPAGTPSVYPNRFTGAMAHEEELLLGRGTTFKVVDVNVENREITVEVVTVKRRDPAGTDAPDGVEKTDQIERFVFDPEEIEILYTPE